MFCPTCRAEYREGFERCATCDVELVAQLDTDDAFASVASMRAALAEEELVPLVMGSYNALLEVQESLRQARLLCVLANQEATELEAGVQHAMYLMVRPEDAERAKGLLGKAWEEALVREGVTDRAHAGDEEDCPACGASVPEAADECPECGLFVGKAVE